MGHQRDAGKSTTARIFLHLPNATAMLLFAAAALPLAPRKRNDLPGPMVYGARDAPGPMIVDTHEVPLPLANLDDDFVAAAEEASLAAAASIKEQTDAIKIEEAKVQESEKAFAAAESTAQAEEAPALGSGPIAGFVSQAQQKMRDDEAAIMEQRDEMKADADKVKESEVTVNSHAPQGYDAAYVAKEKAAAAAAEATMRDDEATIKEQIDAMESGAVPGHAPTPLPYAVQAPAPEAVGVAPEPLSTQAPVAVTPDEVAADTDTDGADGDMSPLESQRKLEDHEDELAKKEEERREAEIEKVQQEADHMGELQQEAQQEVDKQEEHAAKQEEKTADKVKGAKAYALEERVAAAKAAAKEANNHAGDEEVLPTGKASRFSSARKLSKLFLRGEPDDDPEKAGLIIHCFDDTENWGQKWMPSAMRRDAILSSCLHPPRVLKTSPIAELLGKECDYEFDEKEEIQMAKRMGTRHLRDALVSHGVEEKQGITWDKEKLIGKLIKAKRAAAKEAKAERRAAKAAGNLSDDTTTSDSSLVPARSFWSTSVINYDVRSTFGRAGVILSPDHNVVQCAYPADMGTMDSGCNVSAMRMDLKGAVSGSQWGGYNEVLVSTETYLDNLPRSLAAFVFGLRGGDTEDVVGDSAGGTAHIYLEFLDFYNLTEADIPLLRVEYDVPLDAYAPDMFRNATTAPGAVFTDVSSMARGISAKYRRRLSVKDHHRRDEPKLWLGEGHAFREGAQKLGKHQKQQIKRQMRNQKAKVLPSKPALRKELEAEMKERDILRAELKSELLKAKVQP